MLKVFKKLKIYLHYLIADQLIKIVMSIHFFIHDETEEDTQQHKSVIVVQMSKIRMHMC